MTTNNDLFNFGFGDVDDAEAAQILAELQAEGEPELLVEAEAASAAAEAPQVPVDEQQAGEPLIDEQPAEQPEPEAEAEPVTPPTVVEVTQAAEELAMLEALKSWVSDELKAAKARHAGVHAAYVNLGGNRQVELKLPNGNVVGTWNIAESTTELVWDDAAVLAYAAAHSPHNLYEVVDGERAVRYDDVVEYIRLTRPELIKTVVRPAFLTVLAGQVNDDGQLVDADTAEVFDLARRVKRESDGSGRPGWKRPKGKPSGKEQVIAAWRAGEFKNNILEAPPAADQ